MKRKKATTTITTILGKEASIKGDFQSDKSVRIDGLIEGDVRVLGNLIVGSSGRINGNVEAAFATIGGEVVGNIFTEEKVELTSTARVLGDIATQIIVIDEYAIFQGRCNMNQENPQKGRPSAPKTSKGAKRSAKAALQEALKAVEEQQNVEETDIKAPEELTEQPQQIQPPLQ